MPFNQKELDLIKWGADNGKSKDEITQAITNLRTGTIPQKQPSQSDGLLSNLKNDLNTRVEKTGQILGRQDTSALEKGVQVFGQGAGLAANTIEKGAEQIPGVKQAFGAIGAGIQWLSGTPIIKSIGEKIGDSKALQNATQLYETDNNFRDSVDAVANIVRLGGDVQMAADAVNFTKNVTNKILETAQKPATITEQGALSVASENALKAGTELKNSIQLGIAKKNVSPQLQSSANRLFLDGTKNLESPLTSYENYLKQSKTAISDIKADPAISTVGEKIGNAFEKVIAQRKTVGEALGAELKANGKIKINIADAKTNLLNDLQSSGLSYNPKTGNLTTFQGTKFTPQEIKMLNDFNKTLSTLGDNPTIIQIDNFIAKTRSTLEFTKGETGVIGTTNAERIIKLGLNKLKETLNPAVNGNKALKNYWELNKTYSDLSDFIEEGSNYLGKKTASGDFAKDASVAKSSVQSILNNGKKDFLLKLEGLTGYPALDDAVLALQAMKDAGDFRGLSLLQQLSETGIPTSKAGFTQKIIDYALSKGGEFLAGTPEEQTRALLQDLEKNAKIPSTTNTPSSIPPNTGAKINKISQPKTSKTVISKTIPQTKVPVKNSELDVVDKFGLTPTMKDNIVAIIDDYNLNKGKNLSLQEDASALAEDLGIDMPKNYGALVKKLQDLLEKSDKASKSIKTPLKGGGEILTTKIAYHGTQAKQIKGVPNTTRGTMGNAFYLTDDLNRASSFGKEAKIKIKGSDSLLRKPNVYEKSNVYKFDLSKLKIKEFNNDAEFFAYVGDPNIADWFRLAGYDGAHIKSTGNYAIYNPKKLKLIQTNKSKK